MENEEYWGISLDDFAYKIWDIKSEAGGAHYIAFIGTREEARQQIIEAFSALIDKEMYRATSYGHEWTEGEE